MLICFELLYNVQDHAPQAWKPSHRNVRCWPKVMAEASAGALLFLQGLQCRKTANALRFWKEHARDASQMLRQKSLSLREFIPNLQSTYSTKDLDLQNFLVMGIWIIWWNRQMDTLVEYISISSSFQIAADWWDRLSLKKEWKKINEHGIWCKWINWCIGQELPERLQRLHLSDHEKSTQDVVGLTPTKKTREVMIWWNWRKPPTVVSAINMLLIYRFTRWWFEISWFLPYLRK